MIVYSIVVYTSILDNKYFESSINQGMLDTIHHFLEEHNAYRLKNIKKGTTTLNISSGAFYAHNTGDRIIVIAMDKDYKALQEKDPTVQFDFKKLLNKIIAAKDGDDLKTIMHIENFSKDASGTKINEIKKAVDETRKIMAENLEKLNISSTELKELIVHSKNLEVSAKEAADATRRLTNGYKWCGLYRYVQSFAEGVSTLVSDVSETMRSKPENKPKEIAPRNGIK